MYAHAVTPILNVSDVEESFSWFEKFGWTRGFTWGSPPTFGAVGSGACEIFLCRGAQGGRGRGASASTRDGDPGGEGVWMSIWVDDVDEVHRRCQSEGLEVTMPPVDEPWNVREMHVRHPDGHVFRVSQGIEGAR